MEPGKEHSDAMAWADHLEAENPSPGKQKPLWVIWAVFYLVLVIGLLIYSFNPVLAHVAFRAAPADRYLEIEATALPLIVANRLDLMDEQFREIGFEPVVDVVEDGSVPDIVAYLRAYEHRDDEAMGIAVSILSGTPGRQSMSASYVEFSTYFEDGRKITSSSLDAVYPFRLTPEHTYANLPELDDPRDLYRIHAWQVGRAAEGERKFYEAGNGLDHLRWAIREEMETAAQTGYIELNARNGYHTLTWKGAYVAGLKGTWPFEGLAEASREREAKRILQEIEAGR